MPPDDGPEGATGKVGDPRDRVPDRVVVWRLGEALLAAALDAVAEVAPVGPDGRARTREGSLDLVVPRGLTPAPAAGRAVVLYAGGRRVAVPAEEVEGVRHCRPGDVEAPPSWLGALAAPAVRALVRVDDRRIAALLVPDTLPGAP